MKISAAQLRPVPGDIASNLANHLQVIELAAAGAAAVVFFSELSLTGFEPKLAKGLAMEKTDPRLEVFQQRSEAHHLIIGVGLPLARGSKVQIGVVWFRPGKPRQSYAKQQLHADEFPFFVPGPGQLVLEAGGQKLVPAICYESLQVNHGDHAGSLGADVYLASVAKSARGMAKGMAHYPSIARRHSMVVVMANAVGPCDDFLSVGQSAVWNRRGELLAQMDRESEGIVMVDSVTEKTWIHPLQRA